MRLPVLSVFAISLLFPTHQLLADDSTGKPADAPLVPADYYEFEFISDPRISPNGEQVAFVRATVSEDRRSRESAIWMVAADGTGQPRRFTRGDSDRGPRWSPDGNRLAFVSSRKDRPQLHVLDTRGGEARAVTELKQGSLSDWAWMPDGERMVLTLNLNPAVEDPTEEDAEDEKPQADVTRFSRAVYKSDASGLLDEARRGLWLLDVESGELEKLTGDPEWNDNNATVSPDGNWIAFNADRSGEEFDGGFSQDLYLLETDTGQVRQLETPEGRSQNPVFSPDGQWLAYRHQDDRYEPGQVHRIALDGGTAEILHDGIDFFATSLSWPRGSEGPRLLADFRGGRLLFAASPAGIEALTDTRASVGQPSFSEDGSHMAYTLEDETRLAEVWVADADGGNPRQLTRFNEEFLETRDLTTLETFSFENEAGMQVEGFLARPTGFDPSESWPVILNIKGGPAGMWGHQWFHEFQMMAGAGYAVVFTNYRGSTGYGHEFQSAIRLPDGGVAYGEADYQDNMLLVDAALEKFDWMDPDRLYVTGGSHGGFLTNWITTRTDRFQAAVTQRSVSSWISEAGTQAYPPAAMMAEFHGTLWTNFDAYWDRSPLKYADQVSTPTLIIHSEDDHVTPIGQGQEWFYALLNNDVEVEMAQFAGEGHALSRTGTPVNLVKRLELILEWFDRHPAD